MLQNLKTEIKLFLIVLFLSVVIAVGGISLLKTTQPAPVAQVPSPTPTPSAQSQDITSDWPASNAGSEVTAGWQTYRSDEFGFEIQYPRNTSENFSQVAVSTIAAEPYPWVWIGEFEQGCSLYISKLQKGSPASSAVDYIATDTREGIHGTLFFGVRMDSQVDSHACQILFKEILSTFRFVE